MATVMAAMLAAVLAIRDPRAILPNPNQPRKTRDPEVFQQLVESIKLHGILQPPGILEDNTNVFGMTRVDAAIAAGLTEIQVLIIPPGAATGGPSVQTMIENLVRFDLTPAETLIGLETVQRENPSWPQKKIAGNLCLHDGTVSRFFSVGKNPLTREPFLAGKLTLAVASEIVSAAPDAQAGLLNFALEGSATRDQIIARKRKPVDATVKMSRVCCPLSTGTKVTVTGAEMTLEGYIEALASALEAARKANKEALDVRTAEKVWRDKAKVKA